MTNEKRELTDEQIANIWHLCMAIDTAEFCQEFSRELIAADRALNADAGVMRQAMAALELSRLRMTGSPMTEILVITDAYNSLKNAISSAPMLPAQHPEDPEGWRAALQFYAEGAHFNIADDNAWDIVSGEPANFWCDEAGTATVEDGSVAAMALRGTPLGDETLSTPPAEPSLSQKMRAAGFTRRPTIGQMEAAEQQGEQEPVGYKRSEFTKGWTTFNVRRECADAAEARLKGPNALAELRAKVKALPNEENFTGYATLVYLDEVLAVIDKMMGARK